jgi:NAD-dependent SIR2 family protein deacetylase
MPTIFDIIHENGELIGVNCPDCDTKFYKKDHAKLPQYCSDCGTYLLPMMLYSTPKPLAKKLEQLYQQYKED